MTFGQFLSILKARWLLALAVLALTVGVTLGISLVMPKKYKAAASVVLDFKPDPLAPAAYAMMASPVMMATQLDIIRSDRVAQRVARNLKLADNPVVRGQWQDATKGVGAIEVWLAELLQKNMEVEPSRESSVITVSYKAADPRFAAGVANAFVQAYIETSLELRVDPARQYSSFFQQQVKEAREKLEIAQARLSKFQKDNGIIATDERLDVENARLNELSSQYTALQAIAAESTSRQAQAYNNSDRIQEVLSNPMVAQLKADLARAEAKMQELATRYGENHPQLVESRASVQELRTRLDAETRRVAGGVSVSNTINRQREYEIRASLEAQRAKVLRMKAVRDEGVIHLRDADNAQRAYDALQQRFNQTNLESQTTQSNANVLTQAVPPTEPASPRVVLNTVLAFIGGVLLAIAAAMVMELRDRRVRTVEDVVVALDLPVIGALPKPGSKMLLGGRPSLMQQRLMAPADTHGKVA